jgi:hypothetical protein
VGFGLGAIPASFIGAAVGATIAGSIVGGGISIKNSPRGTSLFLEPKEKEAVAKFKGTMAKTVNAEAKNVKTAIKIQELGEKKKIG